METHEGRHAEREAFHREQRQVHADELEALTRRLDEFRAAAAAAMDLALRDPARGGDRLSRRGALV